MQKKLLTTVFGYTHVPVTVTQDTIARMLAGYDDATWHKLRKDRKRTYRRAADSLITQWPEFMKLFEY